MKIVIFWSRFRWSLSLKTTLTISHHWLTGSDNGLAPNRRQAIIRANYGLVYWRIYGSLGVNVLTYCRLYTHVCVIELGRHLLRKRLLTDSAPSHYPYQCWFTIGSVSKNKYYWNLSQLPISSTKEVALQISPRNTGHHHVQAPVCLQAQTHIQTPDGGTIVILWHVWFFDMHINAIPMTNSLWETKPQ